MILIVHLATSENPERQAEYDECLRRNRESGLFEHIEIIEGRPNLAEAFAIAEKFTGKTCVLANSDIWFDETIRLADGIGPKTFYALSRHEPEGLVVRENSQDAWVFRSPCPMRPLFQIGMMGTDGRLAQMAHDFGYSVTNPCLSIKTHHLHKSQIRTHEGKPWVAGQYLCVPQRSLPKKCRVAVYTIAKNEEQFVQRWAESSKGADIRFILDTGSTDGTVEAAKRCGVNVMTQTFHPWRFDKARQAALDALPEDIDLCVSLDMDEIPMPGWLEELQLAFESRATRVAYSYAWTVNPDGTPARHFIADKIHARIGYRWVKPCHEIIVATGEEKRVESKLWIHHLADNSKPRSSYLPLLELGHQEEPDDCRTMFYLAREYTFHNRWPEACAVLKKYLEKSTWDEERAEACILLSRGEPHSRQKWLARAFSCCPNRREVLCELSAYYADMHLWPMSYGMADAALSIVERPGDYLTLQETWTWKPYDLAAVAAFWMGMKEKAAELGRAALEFAPKDERLIRNMRFYSGEKFE